MYGIRLLGPVFSAICKNNRMTKTNVDISLSEVTDFSNRKFSKPMPRNSDH